MTPTTLGPMNRTGSKIPSGYKQYQVQTMTPEQMGLHQQLYQHVDPNSFLGKLAAGDQGAYEEMEAPALRQFSGIQGNLASRFSGMGTGSRRSSGFQNTMNAAASELAQDLASKRLETRMKALEELMTFSDRILGQKPYETGLVQKERQPGFLQALGGGIGGAIPGAITGFMAGGPPGALAGAATGAIGGASKAIQRQNAPAPTPYVAGSGQYNLPDFMQGY